MMKILKEISQIIWLIFIPFIVNAQHKPIDIKPSTKQVSIGKLSFTAPIDVKPVKVATADSFVKRFASDSLIIDVKVEKDVYFSSYLSENPDYSDYSEKSKNIDGRDAKICFYKMKYPDDEFEGFIYASQLFFPNIENKSALFTMSVVSKNKSGQAKAEEIFSSIKINKIKNVRKNK
jgi:hypothetical protein